MTDRDITMAMTGVSQHLVDLINTVLLEKSPSGTPIYSEKTAKTVRKLIICRQYNRPIWWLANLILYFEFSKDLSFIDFLWDRSINKKDALKSTAERLGDNLAELEESGIVLKLKEKHFTLHYSQLPLLQALAEILVYADTQFFKSIETHTSEWSATEVDLLAKKLRVSFDRYLEDHLQPRQQYEKSKKIIEWSREKGVKLDQPNSDIDDHVIQFWQYAIDEKISDFKLFNSCATCFLKIIDIIKTGIDSQYLTKKNDSPQPYYGEWNDDIASSFFELIDNRENIIDKLKSHPLKEIKFFSSKDLRILSELESNIAGHRFFAKTYFRSISFGARQLSISQHLRKRNTDLAKTLITCADVQTYEDSIQQLTEVRSGASQTYEALLHILYKLKSEHFFGWYVTTLTDTLKHKIKAIFTANNASTSIDQHLTEENFDHFEEIVSNDPELNEPLLRFRRSFKAVNREGFKELPNPQQIEVYEDGAEHTDRAIKAVDEKLFYVKEELDTSELIKRDKEVFFSVFNQIYGDNYGT